MPLYTVAPRYDGWIVVLLASILAWTLILGVVMVFIGEGEAAWTLFIVTGFDALLFWGVLPRRYEVWLDRFRIVLGGPFAINLSLANIAEVRLANTTDTMVYWGVRFATSIRTPVEIRRRRGLNFIVSPQDQQELIDRLQEALDAYRELHGPSA